MTREEAIEQLQNCKGLIQQDGQDYLDERDIPLLDMAIEALSAEPCDKDAISREGLLKSWEELSPRGRTEFDQVIMTIPALPSAELPKGDSISRKELMDRLESFCKWCKDGRLQGAEFVWDCIVPNIPSADAVQEWIPCSERLPSESGDYLCTIPLDADETYTEVLMFHKGRFYEDDAEWGATYHDDVLAWMPLPKPYREDGEV